MHGAAAYTLTDRFTWLIDGLCRAIGSDAYKRRVDAVLVLAIWNRVRRLSERFLAVVARVQSGRPRRRHEKSPDPDRSALRPDPPQVREREKSAANAAVKLPREFGWIRTLLPETGQYAGVLAYLLRDPEMAALLEKAPEAGRMLRPLCHLLGVRAPEFLRRGAVVAPTPVGVEAPRSSDPRLTPALSTPEGGEGEAAEAAVADDGAGVTPATQPPPHSAHEQAEEAARRYAQRPGGLYWDGTRMRWS